MQIYDLNSEELYNIYNDLFKCIGPRYWWPADSPFEVIIGAILTQNTTWQNVKKVISNIKLQHLLSPESLQNIPLSELALLIRSSGYYNQKAKKIKNFLRWLKIYGKIDLLLLL